MARNNIELDDITENLAEDVFDHLLHGLEDLGLHTDEVEMTESFRMITMKLILQYHRALSQVAGPRTALAELRSTFKEIELHALAI